MTQSQATRRCRTCSVVLVPGDNWSEGLVRGRRYLCRACNSANGKAHYKKHAERATEVRRARMLKPESAQKASASKSAYYRENREKWKLYHQTAKAKMRQDPWARASRLLTWVRARAARKGCEFDLDVEWIGERLEAGCCEVTGLPLELQISKIGQIHPWGPSVDRIDSSLGYTKQNCQIVCWAYNMAKSDWNHDVVQRLAQAIVDRKE